MKITAINPFNLRRSNNASCNVMLNFESVDEILNCDHSNETYRAVLSCGAVYYVKGG